MSDESTRRKYGQAALITLSAFFVTLAYALLTIEVVERNGVYYINQPPYNGWIGTGVFIITVALAYGVVVWYND